MQNNNHNYPINDINNLSKQQLEQQVISILEKYPLVLFMKGEKDLPACGFSAGVVEILNLLKVDFESINILSNEELRSFMKDFSKWPTFPQLYYKGELLGGYDILVELYQNGELQKILNITT